MTLPISALQAVDKHWAVLAVPVRDRSRATKAAINRHVRSSIGQQVRLDFDDKVGDEERIHRLATAYEIAAAEGIRALLHPADSSDALRLQAIAGTYRAFDLRRALQIPLDPMGRVFHVLHLAGLATCGDRSHDFRRWLDENSVAKSSLPIGTAPWDQRVAYQLFDCWIRLIRKDGWQDLDGVRTVVGGLRQDQALFESKLIESMPLAEGQTTAFRLLALYHWAKASELLAVFLLQGGASGRIDVDLDQHFEAAVEAAGMSCDPAFEVLLRWLHPAARRMAGNSVWRVSEKVNSHVKDFVKKLTTSSRPMFELLPPQRVAIREQGLLDPVDAVVVDLPTSGGKTLLAEFRIIQALDQFREEKGWVAYVAPTRALTSQITRRLRADLGPLGFNVEQLSAAVEIDSIEEAILSSTAAAPEFDVLVATPEKLNLVIRNQKVPRPLALLVLDEAHNIEGVERGLRIELLLATVKTDCSNVRFLLLMPNVPNVADLARWLGAEDARAISLSTNSWQPNDRIIGVYWHEKDQSSSGDWNLKYETVLTTQRTIHLTGVHDVGGNRPLPSLNYSRAKSLTSQTAAMAKVFSERSSASTAIAIAGKTPWVWSMARTLAKDIPRLSPMPPDIELVRKFLAAEVSPDFELVELLAHGIGVHHSGLSDETRSLIELLAERGQLRVLCATTTLAQGINFPVSSIFMQDVVLYSKSYPYQREMSTREFWNLAGRAGRIQHESIGVVGIAAGENAEGIAAYLSHAAGDLASRLVKLLNQLEETGQIEQLDAVIQTDQWTDFRTFIAHLVNEKQTLEDVLNATEPLLRNTFGFMSLRTNQSPSKDRKAKALIDATKNYAKKISANRGFTTLVDQTGFSFETIGRAVAGFGDLPKKLTASDWEPKSLFAQSGTTLPNLVGILMKLPEMERELNDLSSGGLERKQIAALAKDWVGGATLQAIAQKYFSKDVPDITDQITAACRAVYKTLATFGSWGLSALTKLEPSGIDFETLPKETVRRINLIPAMLYYGVKSEAAVLMRMNSVPRTLAESMGKAFAKEVPESQRTARVARDYIRGLTPAQWQKFVPKKATLRGEEYRTVWAELSGEKAGN